MGINNKLTYLNDTKTAIKKAIIDKGVDVLDTDTFRSYAEKIGQIEGGGSGGSGGEVIEAIVDESALPIEASKKVVVANIQATGQGAGALMPFDIVPYGVSSVDSVGVYQAVRDCIFFNTRSSGTYAATIRYKKVGEYKWEGKHISPLNYYIHPNDKITLLYKRDDVRWGSYGEYYNHVTDSVESISFDIEMPQTDSTQANNFFLTHDSKYLWGVQLRNVNNTTTGATEGYAALYRIEEDKQTGKVSAYQIVAPIQITKPAGTQGVTVSVDSYDIYVTRTYSPGNTTDILITYNEEENTLTYQSGTKYVNRAISVLAKHWYASLNSVYYGSPIATDTKAFDLSTDATNFNFMYKDIVYYCPSDKLRAVKIPINAERPKVEDFYVYPQRALIDDLGPCFISDDEILYARSASSYTPLVMPSIMNFKTGEVKDYTGIDSMPIFLLDDGTGYFWVDDGVQASSNKKVKIVVPVNGSYTQGVIAKTLTPGSNTMLYKQINYEKNFNTTSSSSYLTTNPMLYLNGGNSFIFQNTFSNSTYTGVNYSGYFFKDPLEEAEKFVFIDGTLSVDADKAYTTPGTNNLNFTVFSSEGIKNYATTDAKSGLCFEFEGSIYMYKFSSTIPYAGDGCYKVILNNTNMTASFEHLDDGTVLAPIIQYITTYTMHPSYTYPDTSRQSVYNRPVMTKDGKYFVGLAGHHRTHYSKIEKNRDGLPVLNVYEFPNELKNLLHEQEILYFEAYYPSGFGIQLASGNFLMCEYNKGLDVDLQVSVYNPLKSKSRAKSTVYQTHFTSHKKYWYSHDGFYTSSNIVTGYASSCGRREDLPSTYQKRVYSMKHSFAGSDHITGYLTGESYNDDNGKLIAEVEVLRK